MYGGSSASLGYSNYHAPPFSLNYFDNQQNPDEEWVLRIFFDIDYQSYYSSSSDKRCTGTQSMFQSSLPIIK